MDRFKFLTGSKNTGWSRRLDKKLHEHGKQIEGMNQLMNAMMLVVVLMTAALIVMTLGLFMDTWRTKTESCNELQREINASSLRSPDQEEVIAALRLEIANLEKQFRGQVSTSTPK